MARRPSDRQSQVLAPAGGAAASIEVALAPMEVAALLRVGKAGADVLVALGDVTRTGAIDEALRRLHGARKTVELERAQATALAMFAERGIVILGALGEHGDEAAAEAGLVKLRAAMGSR
jgi:hypothetical protein